MTNILLFSICISNFILITAKKISEIMNNAVCVVARLVFMFCCTLTTGRCNDFQHIFVNQNKSEFYGSYFLTMLFLVTMVQSDLLNFSVTFYSNFHMFFYFFMYDFLIFFAIFFMNLLYEKKNYTRFFN